MLEKAIESFENYVSGYDKSIKEINLKYNHSLEVMRLMGELAFRLNLDKEKIELGRLIGLIHDVGRFIQYDKYQKFDDSLIDHGEVAINYLFDDGHIRDFISDNKYDDIIKDAIMYHNQLEISNELDGDSLLFTKMLRDMDKVDVYHQIAINYSYLFKADEVSTKVLTDFKNEKTINKKDRKSKSDSIILMLAFIYDINFNESFDILVETDNFDLFLSMIEVDEDSENLWRKIRELCFDKINRGVDNGR